MSSSSSCVYSLLHLLIRVSQGFAIHLKTAGNFNDKSEGSGYYQYFEESCDSYSTDLWRFVKVIRVLGTYVYKITANPINITNCNGATTNRSIWNDILQGFPSLFGCFPKMFECFPDFFVSSPQIIKPRIFGSFVLICNGTILINRRDKKPAYLTNKPINRSQVLSYKVIFWS